jgi:hypothetical protein
VSHAVQYSKRRNRKWVGSPRNRVGIWGGCKPEISHPLLAFPTVQYSFPNIHSSTKNFELPTHLSQFSTKNNFNLQLIIRDRFWYSVTSSISHKVYMPLYFCQSTYCLSDLKIAVIICKIRPLIFFLIFC